MLRKPEYVVSSFEKPRMRLRQAQNEAES